MNDKKPPENESDEVILRCNLRNTAHPPTRQYFLAVAARPSTHRAHLVPFSLSLSASPVYCELSDYSIDNRPTTSPPPAIFDMIQGLDV